MFKSIPYLIKLHLCKNVEYRVNHVANFSQNKIQLQKTTYSQVQERDPCSNPPDPCPPPRKDDTVFWSALAILVTAGCFAVYGKHTPEFRDWLTINAAWFDDLIAIAYQENKTYGEHARDLVAAVKEFLASLTKEEPRLCDDQGRPFLGPKLPVTKKEKTALEVACPKEAAPKNDVPPKSELEHSVKGICEIEKCLLDAGEMTINSYWTARQACRYYNELVEETLENFTYKKLKALRPAMLERFELLNEHVCVGQKALKTLEELGRILDCGISAPKEAVDNTYAMMKEFMARAKVMQTEYIWEQDRALSLDAKWQNVEKFVDNFVAENQILLSGTSYSSDKPSLKGDPDLLLLHSLRYKNMLEGVLKDMSQVATERTDRGLETLSQDKKAVADRDALIQSEFKKRQAALDQTYKKKLDDVKAEYDKATQKIMKKNTEQHERCLEAGLKQVEEQATIKLNQMVEDEVAAQKKKFALELGEMKIKVQAVEDKLNAIIKAEKEAKRAQQLWTAGASLLAATKKGNPRIRVDKEIKAIEAAAGDGDKLVSTVIKSIPDDVRKAGVVPESVLRERFHQFKFCPSVPAQEGPFYNRMESTARKVALVESEGSPMPVYVVSLIQSLLLFMRLSGISQKDIDKPLKDEKDLEEMDTFDRLHLARYWLEQGKLATALYYVNSLEGASRVAADAWYKDAKSHLEIRQAAETVIAHATAMSLQYI